MQTLVRLLLLSNDRIQRKSDKMIALTMSGDAEKTVTDKKGQINFSFQSDYIYEGYDRLN